MKTSEAFILKKTTYAEADYILSIFTKDFGKITALAKNAKKSSKRFGGRLEPFVLSRISFQDRPGRMHILQECETIKVFSRFMEDVELFTLGSFMIENIEILIPKEDPTEKTFKLFLNTLNALNTGKTILPEILKFQLSVLALSGFMPKLDSCTKCGKVVSQKAIFSIKKGGSLCQNCSSNKSNGYLLSRDFLINADSMQADTKMIFRYIDIFRKFTEYHTGKEIKSFRILKELNQ